MSITNASAFRRRAGAMAIIGLFCLLLASTLLEPTDSHADSDQLRAAAAHPGAMQASAWCEILAGVLAPVVVITLMHVVRRRGVVLAHVGGILGILGSVGGTMIGLHSLFIVALAGDGGGTGKAVLTRLDHIASGIPVLFFALPVALAVLAVADVRARLAPRWVIPVAVLFVLADFVPAPGAEIVQLVLGMAAFGRIAYRILAMSDAEWESGPATGALSAQPATAPAVA
jgi:Domain of unknown function (DUF4386)